MSKSKIDGSFKNFFERLIARIEIPLPESWADLSEIQIAKRFLEKVNEYFYQTYEGIGTTLFNEDELKYFSEFQKFWEVKHREIINARVNDNRASIAARLLREAVSRYGSAILDVTLNTRGLGPQAIAQVRFFTANQDFRKPPEDQFAKYLEDPTQFQPEGIAENPEGFLKFLGMTRLSQTDKRLDYARNAARFLVALGMDAFDLAAHFGHDAVRLQETLIQAPNMGYGPKKTNMFIRDMAALGVWTQLQHFEAVDVASDRNTMKLALRTGVLHTEMPLLSSFLDIFCHQYTYIDEMSALAWRRVWEEWRKADPQTAPDSPCRLDFLLYRLGREYCKDMLAEYICERGHVFYHFGGRLRNCRLCALERQRIAVRRRRLLLPCQADVEQLPRENGRLLMDADNLLSTFGGVCVFAALCQPNAPDFKPLDAPRSISIKGQTSWTDSYADKERGGGGMMG